MLILLLLTGIFGIEAAQSPVEHPLSPRDVVKQAQEHYQEQNPLTVKFRVGAVDTMKVTLPDETSFMQYRLHPYTDFGPSLRTSFYVTLSSETEKTLHRIGIQDLENHFKDKVITVRGHLSLTSLHLISSESFHF